MQPRDFEEELARSGERMRRKKKKLDAINRLVTTTTPLSSPGGLILVQDTQPRSPVCINRNLSLKKSRKLILVYVITFL
jgi:hypothetical protein